MGHDECVIGIYKNASVRWDGRTCAWQLGNDGWILYGIETKEDAVRILSKLDGFKELKED